MQPELLDHTTGNTGAQLASAVFERIESFHNPCCHTSIGNRSPAGFEALRTGADLAA